jgi:hypothetical protein
LRSARGRVAERDNDIGPVADERLGESRKAFGLALGEAKLKAQVAALGITQRRQRIAQE